MRLKESYLPRPRKRHAPLTLACLAIAVALLHAAGEVEAGSCCSFMGCHVKVDEELCSSLNDGAVYYEGLCPEGCPDEVQAPGVCCIFGESVNAFECHPPMLPSECAAAGGFKFHAGVTDCSEAPASCGAPVGGGGGASEDPDEQGACCLSADFAFSCIDAARADCVAIGGSFETGGCGSVVCDPCLESARRDRDVAGAAASAMSPRDIDAVCTDQGSCCTQELCLDTTSSSITEGGCFAIDGLWRAGISCTVGTQCPKPEQSSCCFNGQCFNMDKSKLLATGKAVCEALQGTFKAGPCASRTCANEGACCFVENLLHLRTLSCVVANDAGQCASFPGGSFAGVGVKCGEGSCPDDPRPDIEALAGDGDGSENGNDVLVLFSNIGSCCLSDGTCQEPVTLAACVRDSGRFSAESCPRRMGEEGEIATVFPCPEPAGEEPGPNVGACCSMGVCYEAQSREQCDLLAASSYAGDGTICAETLCPTVGEVLGEMELRGACCYIECEAHDAEGQPTGTAQLSAACAITDEPTCLQRTGAHYPGIACSTLLEDGVCEVEQPAALGACCVVAQGCSDSMPEHACAGTWVPGLSCEEAKKVESLACSGFVIDLGTPDSGSGGGIFGGSNSGLIIIGGTEVQGTTISPGAGMVGKVLEAGPGSVVKEGVSFGQCYDAFLDGLTKGGFGTNGDCIDGILDPALPGYAGPGDAGLPSGYPGGPGRPDNDCAELGSGLSGFVPPTVGYTFMPKKEDEGDPIELGDGECVLRRHRREGDDSSPSCGVCTLVRGSRRLVDAPAADRRRVDGSPAAEPVISVLPNLPPAFDFPGVPGFELVYTGGAGGDGLRFRVGSSRERAQLRGVSLRVCAAVVASDPVALGFAFYPDTVECRVLYELVERSATDDLHVFSYRQADGAGVAVSQLFTLVGTGGSTVGGDGVRLSYGSSIRRQLFDSTLQKCEEAALRDAKTVAFVFQHDVQKCALVSEAEERSSTTNAHTSYRKAASMGTMNLEFTGAGGDGKRYKYGSNDKLRSIKPATRDECVEACASEGGCVAAVYLLNSSSCHLLSRRRTARNTLTRAESWRKN